jgi:putative transposase
MPKGLRRYYGQGHLHFITCSCYRRLPLLGGARSRTALVRILDEVRRKYGFRILGYVVMPEHLHLLISEPSVGTPSKVMQVFKQRVSRRLRGKARRRSTAQLPLWNADSRSLRGFWQRRFHDFNVFTDKKTNEKLRYMHWNPVIRMLVREPHHWSRTAGSSFNFYWRKGIVLLEMDRRNIGLQARPSAKPN